MEGREEEGGKRREGRRKERGRREKGKEAAYESTPDIKDPPTPNHIKTLSPTHLSLLLLLL